MKRGLVILLISVAMGLGMFWCSNRILSSTASDFARSIPKESGSLLPELDWLQSWLNLNGAQLQQVKALHLDYLPKCEAMCHRLSQSNKHILTMGFRSTSLDADMRSAMRERARLMEECQQALLEHVYQTSACMRSEQAQKYLDLMLPYVLGIATSDTSGNEVQP